MPNPPRSGIILSAARAPRGDQSVKKSLKLILVGVLFAGLLPLAGSAQSAVKCPSVRPPKLGFGKPLFIDKNRAGGEPVSVVAQDGSITVSAHAGTTHVYKNPEAAGGVGDFAGSYYNQTLNWRSEDGGESWQYIGLAGSPVGPHSGTSTGFSDPDLAIDGGGNLYNTEIDLANVAVFASPDDGQSWPTANPAAASGDRPWLTGGDEDGEVFLYVNQPKQLVAIDRHGVDVFARQSELPRRRQDDPRPAQAEDRVDRPEWERRCDLGRRRSDVEGLPRFAGGLDAILRSHRRRPCRLDLCGKRRGLQRIDRH